MKKELLLTSLLLSACNIAIADVTSHYYYSQGEKIPLSVDNTRITVRLTGKDAKNHAKQLSTCAKSGGTHILCDSVSYVINLPAAENTSISQKMALDTNSIETFPTYTTQGGDPLTLTGYIYVKAKEDNPKLISDIADKYHLKIISQNEFMPLWYTLCVTDEASTSPLDIANHIFESGLVAASHPELSSIITYSCANDTRFSEQWNLNGSYGINICDAWVYSTGIGTKIAIIDTGVNVSIKDLSPNVVASYDAVNKKAGSPLYKDLDGKSNHGTACAAIACAKKDDGWGIAGVAPNAGLMTAAVNFCNATQTEQLADGINWAVKNGADVISCSWGARTVNDIIVDAVRNATKYGRAGKGAVVVVASGNENMASVSSPSHLTETICVGAIDKAGKRLVTSNGEGSNYGTNLDVVAPGDYIVAAPVVDDIAMYYSGTSMACPHVSGIAALMISANPNLTASEVQNIIKRSCRKLDKYSFSNSTDHPDGTWNNEVGYGLVNAHKAVVMAAAKNIQIEGSPFIESGATATFSLSSPELLKSVAWSVEGKYLRSKIASQSTDPSQALSITTVAGEPYANTLRAKVVDIMGNSFSITREIYPNTRKNNNTFVGRLIQESCSQNGTTYPKLNKALSGPTEYLYKYCSAEIGFAKEYLLGWRCDGSVSVTPSYWRDRHRHLPAICDPRRSVGALSIPLFIGTGDKDLYPFHVVG